MLLYIHTFQLYLRSARNAEQGPSMPHSMFNSTFNSKLLQYHSRQYCTRQ